MAGPTPPAQHATFLSPLLIPDHPRGFLNPSPPARLSFFVLPPWPRSRPCRYGAGVGRLTDAGLPLLGTPTLLYSLVAIRGGASHHLAPLLFSYARAAHRPHREPPTPRGAGRWQGKAEHWWGRVGRGRACGVSRPGAGGLGLSLVSVPDRVPVFVFSGSFLRFFVREGVVMPGGVAPVVAGPGAITRGNRSPEGTGDVGLCCAGGLGFSVWPCGGSSARLALLLVPPRPRLFFLWFRWWCVVCVFRLVLV